MSSEKQDTLQRLIEYRLPAGKFATQDTELDSSIKVKDRGERRQSKRKWISRVGKISSEGDRGCVKDGKG